MNAHFSFTGAKKLVFGRDTFAQLGDHVRELGGKKPMIVIDRNLAAAGFKQKIDDILTAAKLKYVLYDGVEGEPPLEMADEASDSARAGKCDCIVGIGGGSAMDVAKAVAVIVSNKGKAKDYLGLNNIPRPGLPKIMVPTTAGTGSEVTFTSVFIRNDLRKKEGMNSPHLYPELALLDPVLTLTVPPAVTATTGVDALCHAIESYWSIQASSLSEMISLEAIGLIAENLRTCVHNGSDLDARECMLLGSLYAGLGLANAGVTAVHSLSYPLGGRYGIPHGLANTVLLPAVMRFNLPSVIDKCATIAQIMGEYVEDLSLRDAAELSVGAVEDLILDCCIYDSLETLGIPREDFPELAEIAMTVARPLANNPRKVSIADAIEIYEDAY
ncbi:MAG: iron-containing alcohol dehydrogenase [Deltaproteobacteria bacterium]|nr:iron-containing alcohol dehydrogenase [Deltaproteobacteria bacterium]